MVVVVEEVEIFLHLVGFSLRAVLGLGTSLCKTSSQRIVIQQQQRAVLPLSALVEIQSVGAMLRKGNAQYTGHNLYNPTQ